MGEKFRPSRVWYLVEEVRVLRAFSMDALHLFAMRTIPYKFSVYTLGTRFVSNIYLLFAMCSALYFSRAATVQYVEHASGILCFIFSVISNASIYLLIFVAGGVRIFLWFCTKE